MLLSYLLPSRGRPLGLATTLASLEPHPFVDVQVRLDEDDAPSLAIAEKLSRPWIHWHVGKKATCYGDLSLLYQELLRASSADWAMLLNDDMFCTGTARFPEWLGLVPRAGFLVQPEFHRNNLCDYPRDATGPFPCFPRQQEFLEQPLGPCLDSYIYRRLVSDLGWRILFAPALGVVHLSISRDLR